MGSYLIHYGIKGQKHGVRRFQDENGILTEEGKRRYGYTDTGTGGKKNLVSTQERKLPVGVKKGPTPSGPPAGAISENPNIGRRSRPHATVRKDIDSIANQLKTIVGKTKNSSDSDKKETNKDLDNLKEKQSYHAHNVAKATVTGFVASMAAKQIGKVLNRKGGSNGKDFLGTLGIVASSVALGSVIGGAAHTTAWAYNSAKIGIKNRKNKKNNS